MSERTEALLRQLTLAEKVSLAAGASFWTTVPVERVGIPAIKVTDGPNGARGKSFNGEVSSACVPVGIALAATWNPALIERVGGLLADEAKSKGAVVLLGPTVNIHRSPVNGRNFECYSEDPFLSARAAVAYIRGLQGAGVAACVKHFVCNDSEFERQTISSEVTERPLREIYLVPFEAAVKEAGAWSIMSSYNRVNGTYAAENTYTLRDILKGEWGFDGLVMSDWFGTKSTVESANAGLDLEMPGPALYMGDKLLRAVEDGLVSETVIDDKARRLFRLMERVGAFDHPGIPDEQANDRPEHRALLREAAGEAIVLLKNEGAALPLDPKAIEKLAIIGTHAKAALIQGGGSAGVTPHYTVTPFAGIMNAVGQAVEIGYEPGYLSYKQLPLLDVNALRTAGGDWGWSAEFFDNLTLEGAPVVTRRVKTTNIFQLNDLAPEIGGREISARLSGWYTAPTSGDFAFSLVSAGVAKLYIDDREIVDNWTKHERGDGFFGLGSGEVRATVPLTAGQTYHLRIDFSAQNATMLTGLRVGCLPPTPADLITPAVQLAADSDVAIVFAGLGNEWESEGFDRPTLALPPGQDELIARVAAVNPRVIVVLNVGAPITMPWLDAVAGVVLAWYPGQEIGSAIADVLFGAVNPSGRLPETFPKRIEDNPAYLNYPGENGKVYYGEGLFVGYRYYDKKRIEPLFPFGYGLSYTTFAYSNLTLNAPTFAAPEAIRVSVDVTNTGARPGQEVVQLYVRDVEARLARPEKELKGFAKIHLQPGETRAVTFTLDLRSLAYYDPAEQGWIAEQGTFEVLIGASAADIRLTAAFELTETRRDAAASPELFSSSTLLGKLFADERAHAILEQYLPGISSHPQIHMALSFSLAQISAMMPDTITPETLQQIDAALAER